jgi:CspA family cold shock protein
MEITKGTIDCFFNEKGYGFLSDEAGIRRFFHIKDTTPGFRPESGCPVLFEAKNGKKGPSAAHVREDPEAVRPAHPKGRCFCPHCGTSIIPRLVLNIGTPVYSVCSFCGGIVADFRKPREDPRTKHISTKLSLLVILIAILLPLSKSSTLAIILEITILFMLISCYAIPWAFKMLLNR